MNRRDALSIGGATVAAAVAGSLIACADKKKPQDQPPPPPPPGSGSAPADPHAGHAMGNSALAMAAAHCVVAGDACLAHCLILLGDGDTSMAGCAKAVREMLAVCRMLGTLATGSTHLREAAALCTAVCKDCQAECDKHADKHPECKACKDAYGHMLDELAKLG